MLAVTNHNTIIYGRPGHGKTVLGVWMASYYERIHSNVDFFWRAPNGALIKKNRDIKDLYDVEHIVYDDIPGVILLDEMGVNANSRKSMSKPNEIYNELLFLGRKANCSAIWIAQRFMSIDVNGRELSDLRIEAKKT